MRHIQAGRAMLVIGVLLVLLAILFAIVRVQ